jgi:tetratricopeptide (TPR) repeat protein
MESIDIFDFFPSPSKTAALFSKALDLHKEGKLQKALKVYHKILAKNPYHWSATLNIGCIHEDLNDCQQAVTYYKKAMELDPTDYSSFYNCALLLKKRGQYDESLKYYLKAFDLNPDNEDVLNGLGCLYDSVNNWEKALSYYNTVIEKHPYYYKAYHNRGLIFQNQEKYALAIEEFTRAIDLEPSYFSAFQNRSFCYKKTGLYNNAIEDLSKAIALNPKDQWSLEEKAEVYQKKELYKQALKEYRIAAKLRYPEYDPSELVTLHKPEKYNKGAVAYSKLITAGFLPNLQGDILKCFIIRPSKCDRIILKPEEIHVSKSNKSHLNKMKNRYELRFDASFNEVMDRLDYYYKKEAESYLTELRNFYPLINQYSNSIKFVSSALYLDRQLAAGDLGILAGRAYVSLTGFHEVAFAGTAQLILLANEFVKMGVLLWDFGPSTIRWDPYKLALGAKKMTTEEYQKLFYLANPGSENIFTKNSGVKMRK